MKVVNHPPCFVSLENAVETQLMLENPLPADHIGVPWSWDEMPCLVSLQDVELFLRMNSPTSYVFGKTNPFSNALAEPLRAGTLYHVNISEYVLIRLDLNDSTF